MLCLIKITQKNANVFYATNFALDDTKNYAIVTVATSLRLLLRFSYAKSCFAITLKRPLHYVVCLFSLYFIGKHDILYYLKFLSICKLQNNYWRY